MRGLQYYSDDDIMLMHLEQAHSINSFVQLAKQSGRLTSAQLSDFVCWANRLEDYGEQIAYSRYNLSHVNLYGVGDSLDGISFAKRRALNFIRARAKQVMPSTMTPDQKERRLFNMIFPSHQVPE
jgi:hypothetical protein